MIFLDRGNLVTVIPFPKLKLSNSFTIMQADNIPKNAENFEKNSDGTTWNTWKPSSIKRY